ncbi:potassium/proton antiporter [Anoxybacillus ayderensis]|uniref:potassium/proton antiporter n=1 Tax=Anoxybacillus sp. ST70 TaxID=2864180 RepID=UPI0002E4ED96|nr:potassium/proton antiporter [Anoxybacillus sp. ST70]THD16225.1 potassium/proton antiporter [Anoxybacillus ayderensis]
MTDFIIFLLGLLLIIGVLTTKFSSWLGVPSLVFYILVGMILSKFIYFDNAFLTQIFGIFALIVILFEGGMNTKWNTLKKVIVPSSSLATFGVLITAICVGAFAKYILNISWAEGLLLGAIVSSTDAAAIFATLGSVYVNRRLSATLEAESGMNDPMAVILTLSLITFVQNPEISILHTLLGFFWQIISGILIGLGIGKLTIWCMNKIHLDSSGLYPILSLSFAVLSYSTAALMKGSGFLAVYIMAVFVGNSQIVYRHSVFRFNEGLAWMMQIFMFILLGLLVFPNELVEVAWEGIVLAIFLIIVARPISVMVSTIKMRFSMKEKLFLSWAGLKGAVPIVLATYPLIANVENSQLIFNIVFFIVLISALIQGSTISLLAKHLGLLHGEKKEVAHSLELMSTTKADKEIVEIHIGSKQAHLSKMTISQLPLPKDCLITAIIRNEKIITPKGNARLLENDVVYILIDKGKISEIYKIFSINEDI